MKKHLVKVLSIVMALTMVFGVFGPYAVFAQNTDTDHDHDDVEHVCVWGDVVIDDITCDADGAIIDGKIYRECTDANCDKTLDLLEQYNGSLQAAILGELGVGCQQHGAYVYKLTLAPTCTADGTITFTCPVCKKGYGTADVEIPVKKLDHDYQYETTKEDTCTEAGEKVTTCSRCDYSKTEVVNTITEHDFIEIDVTKLNQGNCTGECVLGIPENDSVLEKSTCCTNGYQYKHCSRCDVLSEKQTLPLADHTWITEVFTKTASETKYTIYGESYTLDEVEANFIVVKTETDKVTIVKEFVDGTVDCDDSQFRYKQCEVCSWKVQINKACDLAHGHKWEAKDWNGAAGTTESEKCLTAGWVETKPNCVTGQPGYLTRECTVCGATSQVNYTAWAHTMDRYSCTDGCAAGACDDCTHEGRYVECSVCYATNDTKTEVPTCEDHTWVKGTVVTGMEATCKTPGTYNFACSNTACGQTKTEAWGEPNPKNHGDLQDETIVDATCGKPGSIEGYCNECQTYVNEVIPQITDRHTGKVTDVTAVTPDCVTPGKTEGWHCTDCGASEASEDLPVDPKTHNANCVKQEVLTIEATCCAGGGTIYYWTLCGLKDASELELGTKAPGIHFKNYVEWTGTTNGIPTATNTPTPTVQLTVALKAPTCTEVGYHAYTYCKECGVITAVDTTTCTAAGCALSAADHQKMVEKVLGTSTTPIYTVGTGVEDEDGNLLAPAAIAETLKIKDLGHHWYTAKPAKAETCNAPGNVAEIYCDRDCCAEEKVYKPEGGVLQNGATIAPHGYEHIFYENTVAVDPTCTETGMLAGKFCSKCAANAGCTYCQGNDPVVDALGHNVVKVATVVEGDVSYDVYKCDRVGCYDYFKGSDAKTGDNTYTDTHGVHVWYAQNYTVATVTAPAPNTCEHETSSKDTTLSFDADCDDEGLLVERCDACREITKEEVVPANGHKNAEGNVIYLDCQNYKTYEGQVCADCGMEAGTNIQHNFELVQVDASCEFAEELVEGTWYYECTDCELTINYIYYQLGMGIEDGKYIAPDYQYANTKLEGQYKPAVYVSTVEYVPATSTEDGHWTWNCVCGEAHTQVLKFSYGVDFDITVNPYTYNTDAEQELSFVNGGLIEVLVSVTAEDLAIKALNYTLEYDINVLEFINAELVYDTDAETEGVQNDFGTPICNDNAGTIKFLAMTQVGADSVALDGEAAPMIKFIFRVGEGVQTIAADDVLSTGVEFNEEVVATVAFGNLTEDITVNLIGDFTGDGKYTVDDVLALQEIINNPELPYTNVGDFNNDGRISIADFAAFAKFITSKATVADYYTLLNGAGENTDALISSVAGVIDVNADWTTILGLGTVNGVLSTPVAP